MKILHYVSIDDTKIRGHDEYIILADDDDMPEPLKGFRLNRSYECECDSGSLPLDRVLVTVD